MACLDCPAGTYKGSEKTVLSEDCMMCPDGFISEAPVSQLCSKCQRGTFTTGQGSSMCSPCDLGLYSNASNVCTSCPKGYFQDEKKQLQCKVCPTSRWSSLIGATSLSECSKCPSDRSTGNLSGASSLAHCLCKKHEYYNSAGTRQKDNYEQVAMQDKREEGEINEDRDQIGVCKTCPANAVCPEDGSMLDNLYAEKGAWQPSNLTTEFIDCATAYTDKRFADLARTRCCPVESECWRVPRNSSWTTDHQCQTGYSGPLCTSCSTNYVFFADECIPCDGGSPFLSGIIALIAVSFIIFLVMLCVLRRIKPTKATLERTKSGKLSNVTSVPAGKFTRLSGIVTILISWLQILSALTITYKMRWPSNFSAYSRGAGTFVNLRTFQFLRSAIVH